MLVGRCLFVGIVTAWHHFIDVLLEKFLPATSLSANEQIARFPDQDLAMIGKVEALTDILQCLDQRAEILSDPRVA